jgi:LytS/YehU family sensor histidine kinase
MVLENSKSNSITLRHETEMIDLYIELEQLRFDGSFTYVKSIDPSLDLDNVSLPSMLLQPIVENAIWHGLLHSYKKEKELAISIRKNASDDVEIEIRDNGVGREKSKAFRNAIRGTSMGSNITEERLKLLYEQGYNNAPMTIQDLYNENGEVAGTLVKLIIPAVKNEKAISPTGG